MNDIRDKQKGCFYGLAIGDALGAAVEFRSPGSFAPVFCYRGFGPHGLDPGEWTDDTSMALALADSLSYGWSTKDQLQRYLNWFINGEYSVNGTCFDIGNTTRHALYEFELNNNFKANSDVASSGNGSIMRLAPVVIKYLYDIDLLNYASLSSSTTHASPYCLDSCKFLAFFLKDLMLGKDREEAIKHSYTLPLCRPVFEGVERYKTGNVVGSGFVIESLGAAVWAFMGAENFKDAVLRAVNLGDDADTTGAVAGQMAGAYWGYEKIDQDLIDGLARKDMIEKYLNPILGE